MWMDHIIPPIRSGSEPRRSPHHLHKAPQPTASCSKEHRPIHIHIATHIQTSPSTYDLTRTNIAPHLLPWPVFKRKPNSILPTQTPADSALCRMDGMFLTYLFFRCGVALVQQDKKQRWCWIQVHALMHGLRRRVHGDADQ